MAAARDVFINLPFDERHETHYLALIAGLVALGLNPRCVLEVPPSQDRIRRLVGHIRSCRTSIHDLSEVRLSRSGKFAVPRFNMPFELGLAVAITDSRATRRAHEWRVLESHPYRIQQSLSDLNGYEPYIHGDTVNGILSALVDMFSNSLAQAPLQDESDLRWVYGRLRRFRSGIRGTIFRPAIFRQLVLAAVAYRGMRVTSKRDS